MKEIGRCEKCGMKIEVSNDFHPALTEAFKEQFFKDHKCKQEKTMSSKNGKNGNPEQMGFPLSDEEIEKLQKDLLKNVLLVNELIDEKATRAKAYNEVIQSKQTEIKSIAETLRDQGKMDVSIDKLLKGIHKQIEDGLKENGDQA